MLKNQCRQLFYIERQGLTYDLANAKTYEEAIELIKHKSTKPSQQKLHLPFDFDTEFQIFYPSVDLITQEPNVYPSKLLTTQLRFIDSKVEDTLIYSVDFKENERQINRDIDFIPLQPLVEDYGFSIKILGGREQEDIVFFYKDYEPPYPVLNMVMYTFFATVDIFKAFIPSGTGYKYLKDLASDKNSEINDQKHFEYKKQYGRANPIRLPYMAIAPDGTEFRVELEVIDIRAIHGDKVSLAEVASNLDYEMPYKDKITNDEKENMLGIYEQDWSRFRQYAIGNCISHEILRSYRYFNESIYKDLGFTDYITSPKLTIGSTVADLFTAAILKEINQKGKGEKDINLIKNVLELSPISEIKKPYNLLQKVFGGRCVNAQPTHISTEGVICDSDIKGAYATALENQLMPLGKCEYVENIPLQDYLEQHHKNAEDNLELVIVTVGEFKDKQLILSELPEPQNFIPSYSPPDSKKEEDVRIYTHQIFNAPFTTSTFRWLEEIATPELRKYIKEYGQVIVAAYYDKKHKVSVEEFDSILQNLKQKVQALNEKEQDPNKNKQKLKKLIKDIPKWTAVGLGEIIVTQLKKKREEYTDTSNKHLNKLYKLYTNTIYGVVSSKYFSVSNPVVVNNVTSDVRLYSWMMETATGAYQTITDGVSWNINKVIIALNEKGKQRPLTSRDFFLHRQIKDLEEKRYKQQPVDRKIKSYEWKELDVIEKHKNGSKNLRRQKQDENGSFHDKEGNLLKHELIELIDEVLLPKHLINCFPTMEMFIKKFKIESKGLYKYIATDASAHYALERPDHTLIIKKRSYDTKEGGKVVSEKYYFHDLRNSQQVPIPDPYIKYEILKFTEYSNRYRSNYQYSRAVPGDRIPKVQRFRPFSLSQFLFKTKEQRDGWLEEENNKRVKNTGLSVERFYYDEETDTVNLKQMLEGVDTAIHEGRGKNMEYQRNRQREWGGNSSIAKPYPVKKKEENLNYWVERAFDEPNTSYIHEITSQITLNKKIYKSEVAPLDY